MLARDMICLFPFIVHDYVRANNKLEQKVEEKESKLPETNKDSCHQSASGKSPTEI